MGKPSELQLWEDNFPKFIADKDFQKVLDGVLRMIAIVKGGYGGVCDVLMLSARAELYACKLKQQAFDWSRVCNSDPRVDSDWLRLRAGTVDPVNDLNANEPRFGEFPVNPEGSVEGPTTNDLNARKGGAKSKRPCNPTTPARPVEEDLPAEDVTNGNGKREKSSRELLTTSGVCSAQEWDDGYYERPDSCGSCNTSRVSSKKELVCEGHKSFATCTRCKITKQACKSNVYRDDEPFVFTTRPGMRAGRRGPGANSLDDQRSASVATRSASVATRSASVATRSASVTLPVPIVAAAGNEFESNVVATLQTLNTSIEGLASALVHHGVLPSQWRASPIARIGVGLNQAPSDPTRSNPQTTGIWHEASPIAVRIDFDSNQATRSNPKTTGADQTLQEDWWENFSADLNPAVPAAQAQIEPSFSFPIPEQYDNQAGIFYSNSDINQPYGEFLQGSSGGRSTREEDAQWESHQQTY